MMCFPGEIRKYMPIRARSIALFAALLIGTGLAGCASTSKIMLGAARPALAPEQVRIYSAPPLRFEEIARLETSSAIGFGTAGQTDAAIDKLRREAAALGANGVLLLGVDSMAPPVGVGIGTGIARRHVGVFGSVGIPTTQRRAVGIAIYVIQE